MSREDRRHDDKSQTIVIELKTAQQAGGTGDDVNPHQRRSFMMRFIEDHQRLAALAALLSAFGALFGATAQVVAQPSTKVVVVQNDRSRTGDAPDSDLPESGEGDVPPTLMKQLLLLDPEGRARLQERFDAWYTSLRERPDVLGFYFDRMSNDELFTWATAAELTPHRNWSREQLLAGLHASGVSVLAAKMAQSSVEAPGLADQDAEDARDTL
jgi:hypothetical protein